MATKTNIQLKHGSTTASVRVYSEHASRVDDLSITLVLNQNVEVTPIELHALFLEHCALHDQSTALVVFDAFCQAYGVPAVDIHVVVQQHSIDETAARQVLKAYYLLWDVPAARHCYFGSDSAALPALFAPDNAHVAAMFGGQPGSSLYLDEARWLLDVYRPLLTDFVAHMSAFLDTESRDVQFAPLFKKGLDVLRWLTQPESAPDAEYLVSAPVSMPLTGLVQLMQIMVLSKTLGVSPGQFSQLFKVAVGHSQGIAIATALSMLSDDQSLYDVGIKILGLLLLIGALPQIQHPKYRVIDNNTDMTTQQSADATPRPMVYVRGLEKSALETVLVEFNDSQQSDSEQVHLAVINSYDQFVVAGTVMSAAKLVSLLRSRSADPSLDQSKVPFSQRKPVITASYVDITVPYHSNLLCLITHAIYNVAQEKGWVLDTQSMQLPVRACDDGHDICSEEDVTRYIIESICVLPVNWPRAIAAPDVTHIVDFGTGGFSGFGQLAFKNVEGRGIPVICAGALLPQSTNSSLGTKADLYQPKMVDVITAPNWLVECGPQLVRTAHDDKVHIDTRMHRVLGMPTVMVAGMTPTTVNEQFVAAINNAGYHAEIAGGGMHTEGEMADKLQTLSTSIGSGIGITLNCIYINPRQWGFQFPALLRMRNEGVPIAGLCIGGGVPSLDQALEIIDSLRAADIRHVSFKPSTAEAIRHVVRVAQASRGYPIVLQWTGGRGGGHHSYEDFHQPILETYAAIRACDNIALVAGSGFGDAEGSLPYVTGDWSIAYGRAPMPFDGILLGSRVMVAQEAGTSLAAKQLIVATAGLLDSEWDRTYAGAHNGVITITSEYGEMNHMIATRGIMFIREMFDTILNQPREKREALLLARKDEIISRLNNDYMRPWFGQKTDGRVVDLEEMTYTEVISRAVNLMYVAHQQRWTDASFCKFVIDFVDRVEGRMCITAPGSSLSAELFDVDPREYATRVSEMYPESVSQLLTSEDVQFFISMCKRRGQKPLPFVPVLDVDFGVLFMKDMTCQSDDLDSVINQDPQRVCIQQGPVAVQYSTVVDEPVKDILDGIYHGHITSLVQRLHDGDESQIPVVEYIGAEPVPMSLSESVGVCESETERVFVLPTQADRLPELDAWLQMLAGPHKSWLNALVTASAIVQDAKYADNYIRKLLRARPGRTATVHLESGLPSLLTIVDADGVLELTINCDADRAVRLTIYHKSLYGVVVPFSLEFTYNPSQNLTPIHGSKQRDDESVRKLCIDTWVANAGVPTVFEDVVDSNTVVKSSLTITEEHSRGFCESVGNQAWQYTFARDGILQAPMEYAHIAFTRNMLRLLQSSVFGFGQVNVVHMYNDVTLEDGARSLILGDELITSARIDGLVNLVPGKKITLYCTIERHGKKVATVKSAFLSRSHYIDIDNAFERYPQQLITIMLPSAADIAALELNEWFIYCEDTAATLKTNAPIEFCLDSEYRYKSTDMYSSINTTGTVTVQGQNGKRVTIAKVDYKWDTAVKDPVVEFLNRFKVASDVRQFADGGYLLTTKANAHLSQATVPDSNANYAKYSLDGNPFHLNPYISDFAELPGTITHGMWTSASTRAIVENLAADGQPERIRAYRTEFTGMVFPTDQLETELVHVGMKNGRMLVKGQTSKIGGAPVMDLTAEIDQPLTAYVFTGQGSQEVGMGMALYEQSAPARAVWDRANQHMLDTYDIDLLDIVRTNPREVTVYFNGRAGERIRRNYMSLTKRSPGAAADSKESLVPIIPEITPQSSSYAFRAATGLLNATQFTQTSLILVALAAVADMRAHGLVQKDAIFAGHSLGEYCALAAIGDIFSIEGLLDITFYRGLIMQTAVPRDAQGRSEFGMAAIDPSRIGTGFSESALLQVIDAICDASPGLLQVVNYNVRGNQYVTSGTLVNLAVLRLVLDEIASAGMPNDADFESSISQIVSQVLAKPFSAAPVRGKVTIPLRGIDVPFHSRQLLGGVAEFRSVLYTKVNIDTVSPDLLFRRYIPNLTAVPFEVTQGYFEMVHAATGSPVASEILSSWTDDALENPVEKKRLAVALLVELMAYQLAAPVQWIKTQDCLFSVAEVQRMVEVGPSPVLCGMADKTLRNPSFANSSVLLLHFERNRDEIYYVHTAEEVEVAVEAASTPTTSVVVASAPATQSEQPAALPAQAQVSVGVSSGAGAAIDDVPLPAADIVHAIVAFKLKQPLSGVSAQQSIKMLVGGKSTLQNEIVGDLQKEFGTRVPDKPEDMSLQELGAAIGTSSSMGKCSQPLVARVFGSKMPGGFTLSSARAMLQTAYGLGSQRQDALLLMALTMEPAARLGSDADAGTWLATVAQAYAAHTGIAYSATQALSADGASQGPTVSSAELKKVRLREIEHIQQQIAVLARYAGIDLRSDGRTAEGYQTGAQQLQTSVDNITAEFGDDLIAGVQPRFDARKIRRFDSCWNWARQDAYEWIQQTIAVCTTGVASDVDVSDEARLQQLQNRADVQLVQMLAGTAKILGASNNDALQPAIQLTQALHDACKDSLDQEPVYREFSKPMQPETHVQSTGEVKYTEKPRPSERSWAEYIQHMSCGDLDNTPPLMHLREQTESGQWTYSDMYSGAYFSGLNSIATQGISFAGKTALVTGCGRGSIGAEIVSSLLAGGAKVLATTSSYSRATTLFFENLYRTHGSRGSELVVVPFNQGSVQDIENLVSHVYGKSGSELNWNLDYVFPFAAVSDIGSTLTNLGSRSELAQRVILTNVLRLLGRIKAAKESAGRSTRPALVVLPLSPNHGTFGGDGFYGECKIGLETAFNRWESESWEKQLAIAGAVIGWTRGTGLMSGNNLVAQNIEELGVRTYSTREMALNILGLLQPSVTRIAYRQPVWADFGGGMGRVRGLNAAVSKAREAIDTQSKILRRIATDKSLEFEMTHPVLAAFISSDGSDISPLAKHKNHTPAAKSYESLGHLRQLQGMANLDKVVVITGFGEVSPHGNAETRWEIEAFGELTMEGCIELAWIMGLVKHHNGLLPATGQQYIGWVDVKSGAPVKDVDIKPRYHEYILAHTGIRLIEPELSNGYDPAKKQALREVQIEHDMEPFEASADEAAAFKQSNGDKVDIWENASSGSWSVRFLKGALIRVPMAVSATRLVAGLLPTGWDATRFGIPEDIVKQVDPITLYTLVAAVEALVKSGITDPYELYKHFHVSEVGNTIGSGLGGVRALQEMFKHRALDRETRGDALQETFISTVQAWVNMLLMSSAGPVKPAVGACATAVLSIDTAIDTIQSGKAKVMLAGGVDDFMEESSTEFASMGATSNAVDELASGRTPSEMCRPCTTTRNGFMEGHGAGVVVLMSASAAIACGAPIHGIVGMSATATDKQGRSVPAPGQGVMGSARESSSPIISRLLNVDYRRRRFEAQLATLDQWKAAELAELEHDAAEADDATVAAYTAEIELSYKRQHAALQDTWGNEFWKQDANISPLRGSLAVWGLTADDIGMASFHGTSTQANDKNESSVLNAQLKHLGRTPGHVVPVVCQKWLTGHAKGAAASFMLNGVLQSLRSGLVPGNRNADNIAAELKQFDYSLYLSQTIQTTGIKAALLKSFGFGQVGGELLVIHPDYLLATLEQSQLEAYNTMLEQRSITSFRYWQDVLVGNHSFVQVKSQPPFSKQQEQRVYLDPQARASLDAKTGEYHF